MDENQEITKTNQTTQTKDLDVSAINSEAWHLFGTHWKALLWNGLLFWLLNILIMGILHFIFLPTLSSLVGYVASSYLFIGWNRFLLEYYDNGTSKFETVFCKSDWKQILWIAPVVALISNLGILLGCLLLIVPGIILSIRWSMAAFPVVANNTAQRVTDPTEDCFKWSWRITQGYFWDLAKIYSLQLAYGFLGLLAFGVGVIPAIILGQILWIVTYRKMVPNPKVASQFLPS